MAHGRHDAERGAAEGRVHLSHQLLEGVFLRAEAARKIPPQARGMACGVTHLVERRPVPVDRFEIGGRWRHLDIVERRNIEGAIPADAEIDTSGTDQRLDPRLDHAWRWWWCLDSDVLGQAFALRRVEHGETLQERDASRFFTGLAGSALLVFRGEAVGIDDRRAVLALTDIAAEGCRLAIGEPML